MPPSFDHVVVIGASAGGVTALLEVSNALPHGFPAPVCIVQHIGRRRSLLPELLRHRGPNHAVHPRDGEQLAPGTLYVAPPDCHMLLHGDVLQLRHGPKEGGANVEQLDPIAIPSALTCPDCGGSLWEMKDTRPLRYRCHVGNAYSALSLAQAQTNNAEHALWNGVRALREREMLLRRVVDIATATGDAEQAAAASAEADRLRAQSSALLEMTQQQPQVAEREPDAAA